MKVNEQFQSNTLTRQVRDGIKYRRHKTANLKDIQSVSSVMQAELKAIEEVNVGDHVLAWDEGGRKNTVASVKRLFLTPEQPIFNLTYSVSDGESETIQATCSHPIWVIGIGWVAVNKLQVGDVLQLVSGGKAKVLQIDASEKMKDVFNFEVEGVHNYFVGSQGVLVHNSSGGVEGDMKMGGAAETIGDLSDDSDEWWDLPGVNLFSDSTEDESINTSPPRLTGTAFQKAKLSWLADGGVELVGDFITRDQRDLFRRYGGVLRNRVGNDFISASVKSRLERRAEEAVAKDVNIPIPMIHSQNGSIIVDFIHPFDVMASFEPNLSSLGSFVPHGMIIIAHGSFGDTGFRMNFFDDNRVKSVFASKIKGAVDMFGPPEFSILSMCDGGQGQLGPVIADATKGPTFAWLTPIRLSKNGILGDEVGRLPHVMYLPGNPSPVFSPGLPIYIERLHPARQMYDLERHVAEAISIESTLLDGHRSDSLSSVLGLCGPARNVALTPEISLLGSNVAFDENGFPAVYIPVGSTFTNREGSQNPDDFDRVIAATLNDNFASGKSEHTPIRAQRTDGLIVYEGEHNAVVSNQLRQMLGLELHRHAPGTGPSRPVVSDFTIADSAQLTGGTLNWETLDSQWRARQFAYAFRVEQERVVAQIMSSLSEPVRAKTSVQRLLDLYSSIPEFAQLDVWERIDTAAVLDLEMEKVFESTFKLKH